MYRIPEKCMGDSTIHAQNEWTPGGRSAAADAATQEHLDQRPWKDAEWNSLITSIRHHNVIPVVGPGLMTVETEHAQVRLYRLVAERLAGRLGLELHSTPSTVEALHEIICCCKRRGFAPANLLPDLCDIMADIKTTPSPALRHLGEIHGFRLFVSTTPDRLLEKAIADVRFAGRDIVTSLVYSLGAAEDLPQSEEELKDLAGLSPPVVFHQFGLLCSTPNSCALTEEDLLEFFYNFQRAEKSFPKLLSVLRDRQLLFLGTTWPDWFNRFFLRNARRERFTKKEQMDYLVGDIFAGEQSFVSFLEDFTTKNTTRILARDPVEFVRELRDRWIQRYPSGPQEPVPLPTKMGRSSLFISYAREDLAAVEQLRTGLEQAGLEVWFDQRQIAAGDDWKQRITANLRTCLYFLPVISQRTELADFDRYFREEWAQVEELARRSDRSRVFIIPIKIDEGPHEKIPQVFSDKDWVFLPDGLTTPQFIEEMKDKVAKRNAERHGP
jgi:hypothetical protein